MFCSVLQCVAPHRRNQGWCQYCHVKVNYSVIKFVAACCGVLWCVALYHQIQCCSLKCVALSCSIVWQRIVVCALKYAYHRWAGTSCEWVVDTSQRKAAHCSTLQHTATHCNTLQHTATRAGRLALDCFIDLLYYLLLFSRTFWVWWISGFTVWVYVCLCARVFVNVHRFS